MLIVISAMEQELGGIRRLLKDASPSPAELHVVGIGRERIQANVGKLLDSVTWPPPDGLLMLGFAGGLDPALKAGDLVVPRFFYSQSGDWTTSDDEMWHQARVAAMESGLALAQGNSLTVDAVVGSTDDKRELYRQHEVGSVNMEDYCVARVATDARVPFLSVRAILDPADQALPDYALGLAGHPVEAALGTLPKPWRVPCLVKLAKMRNRALGSVTRLGLAVINRQALVRERELAEVP